MPMQTVRKNRITLKGMSEQLGLGISTVSTVLNGKHVRCRPETTQKILQLAKQLNYRPNLLAKSLKQQKTNTIGLISPGLEMQLSRIEQKCWEAGYNLNITATHYNQQKQTEIIIRLRQQGVDGLLVFYPLPGCSEFAEQISENYPIVVVDNVNHYSNIDTFIVDINAGTFKAIQHLIELGHTKIAAVFSASTLSFSKLREKGWKEGLKTIGVNPPENWFIPLGSQGSDASAFLSGKLAGIEFVRRFAKDDHKRPTAIYCSVDEVAIGVIEALLEKGWKVPHDVSVIGMQAMEMGQYSKVPVTSIDIQHIQARFAAVDHLLNRVRGMYENSRPSCQTFNTCLVKRESTAQPPF